MRSRLPVFRDRTHLAFPGDAYEQSFSLADVRLSGGVPHDEVMHYRAGRVLAAGDAAHVHSPAGGQGMNIGIQDGILLADALARVLAGGSKRLLDEYAQRRRPVAEQVVGLADRLTRIATVLPKVRNELAWRLSGLVYGAT